MKSFLTILLVLLAGAALSLPRMPGYRRPLYVSWKTIAAGGAAAGTVVAAYKISNGVEEGLKTAAKGNPEVFRDTIAPLRWTLWLALLGISCWFYKKITSKMKGKHHGENLQK